MNMILTTSDHSDSFIRERVFTGSGSIHVQCCLEHMTSDMSLLIFYVYGLISLQVRMCVGV